MAWGPKCAPVQLFMLSLGRRRIRSLASVDGLCGACRPFAERSGVHGCGWRGVHSFSSPQAFSCDLPPMFVSPVMLVRQARGQVRRARGQVRQARGQVRQARGQVRKARGQVRKARGQAQGLPLRGGGPGAHAGALGEDGGPRIDRAGGGVKTGRVRAGEQVNARTSVQREIDERLRAFARKKFLRGREQHPSVKCDSFLAMWNRGAAKRAAADVCTTRYVGPAGTGQVRQARGQVRQARGQVRQARGQVRQARGQVRQARGQVRQARGQVRQARGQVRQARGQAQGLPLRGGGATGGGSRAGLRPSRGARSASGLVYFLPYGEN